jgi:hypothetical protein
MMMGRDRKRADSYSDPDAFFGETERRKLWSSRQLSQILLEDPEYRELGKLTNFERILLVWKHTFERTWHDGRLLFGDRYVLLRNEELRADTAGAIGRVYETAGLPTPPQVTEWARDKVRPPEQVYAGDDPRWARAFAKLGMRDALVDAGYGELAEREAPPEGGSGFLGRLLGR